MPCTPHENPGHANAPLTFAVSTVGCKVNQYDSQVIREHLAGLGHRETPFRSEADLYVINTCTVTRKADERCRRQVRRALRRNPQARVVVTGCGARTNPEQFSAIPGVSAVLTLDQMPRLEQWLAENCEPPAVGRFETQGISGFAKHSRAFLKIQDGCSAHCSYCIVPTARGPAQSRPLEQIGPETARLVEAGFREIVLTGIHLGHYGRETRGTTTLADAMRAVLDVPGVERLRLSSLEAMEVTDEIIALAAADSRVCPHFHLPLQSGDDTVLQRMNRRYTAAEFLRVLDRVRTRLDRPSFTTDVMVGFPGETESHFENTLRVCRDAGFSRIHIFPFSPRTGTPAAGFPDQVEREVIQDCEARLHDVADTLALEYKQLFMGETVHPLAEHKRDKKSGLLCGWTARYLRTLFEGPDDLAGRIVPVTVKDITPAHLKGTRVSKTANQY